MGGDHRTLGGTLSHGARVGELDYFVSAETLETDGYIENMDGTPRDWQGSSFGTRLGYALGDGAELGLFAQFSTGKGGREMYVEDADHSMFRLSYRRESPSSPGSVFTANAYANLIDQTLEWKMTGQTGLYDSLTSGLQLQQGFLAGDAHEITIGAEVRSDDIDVVEASGFSPAGSVKADSTVSAFYLQDVFSFGDQWSLMLSARLDYQDEFGDETSPRVGLVRKLENEDKLYVSVAKGYRAPSASDLHLPQIDYGGFLYEGNPDLQPERHWAVEIGGAHAVQDHARLGWSLFYDLGIDSWDYLPYDPGPPMIFRPQNVGQSTYGVELEAEIDLGKGLAFRASYTYVRAKYDEYAPDPSIEGNLVEDVPEHSASVSLVKTWPGRLTAEAIVRMAGERFTDAENNEDPIPGVSAGKLDGFTVMDLRFTVPLGKGMSINASIMNVFDVNYAVSVLATQEPLPQPGRRVYGGMRARF
jgi:outer membrane receptor protein involved in Fe transport